MKRTQRLWFAVAITCVVAAGCGNQGGASDNAGLPADQGGNGPDSSLAEEEANTAGGEVEPIAEEGNLAEEDSIFIGGGMEIAVFDRPGILREADMIVVGRPSAPRLGDGVEIVDGSRTTGRAPASQVLYLQDVAVEEVIFGPGAGLKSLQLAVAGLDIFDRKSIDLLATRKVVLPAKGFGLLPPRRHLLWLHSTAATVGEGSSLGAYTIVGVHQGAMELDGDTVVQPTRADLRFVGLDLHESVSAEARTTVIRDIVGMTLEDVRKLARAKDSDLGTGSD